MVMEKRRAPKAEGHPKRGEILGLTRDGVAILKPRSPATHFTDKEIRSIVWDAHSGRFLDAVDGAASPYKGK